MASNDLYVEGAKAATYVIGLAIVALWNERKRAKGTSSHERTLDDRFNIVTEKISEHRLTTEQSLSAIQVSVAEIAAVVGVNSENGIRGTVKEMRSDIRDLQRDLSHPRNHYNPTVSREG